MRLQALRWFPALHREELALVRTGGRSLRGVPIETRLCPVPSAPAGTSPHVTVSNGEVFVPADQHGPALIVKKLPGLTAERDAVSAYGVDDPAAAAEASPALAAFIDATIDLLYPDQQPQVQQQAQQPIFTTGSADGGRITASRGPPPGLTSITTDSSTTPLLRANRIGVPIVEGEAAYATALRAVELALPQAMLILRSQQLQQQQALLADGAATSPTSTGDFEFELTSPLNGGMTIKVEVKADAVGQEVWRSLDPLASLAAQGVTLGSTSASAALLPKLWVAARLGHVPTRGRNVAVPRLLSNHSQRVACFRRLFFGGGSAIDGGLESEGFSKQALTSTATATSSNNGPDHSGLLLPHQLQQQQHSHNRLSADAPDFDPTAASLAAYNYQQQQHHLQEDAFAAAKTGGYFDPQQSQEQQYQGQLYQEQQHHQQHQHYQHDFTGGSYLQQHQQHQPGGGYNDADESSFANAGAGAGAGSVPFSGLVPLTASGLTPEMELAQAMREKLTAVCSLLATAKAVVEKKNPAAFFPFSISEAATQMMKLSQVHCNPLPLPPTPPQQHEGGGVSPVGSLHSNHSSSHSNHSTPPSAGTFGIGTGAGAAGGVTMGSPDNNGGGRVGGRLFSPHGDDGDDDDDDDGVPNAGVVVNDVLSKLNTSGGSDDGDNGGSGNDLNPQSSVEQQGQISGSSSLNTSGTSAVEPYTLYWPEPNAAATSATGGAAAIAADRHPEPAAVNPWASDPTAPANPLAASFGSPSPHAGGHGGSSGNGVPVTPYQQQQSVIRATGPTASFSPYIPAAHHLDGLYKQITNELLGLNEYLALLKNSTFQDKQTKQTMKELHETNREGQAERVYRSKIGNRALSSLSEAAMARFNALAAFNANQNGGRGFNAASHNEAKMRFSAARRAFLDAGVIPLCLIGVDALPHLPLPLTGHCDSAAEANNQIGCCLELLVQCLTNIAFDVAAQRQITNLSSVCQPLFAILQGKLKGCLSVEEFHFRRPRTESEELALIAGKLSSSSSNAAAGGAGNTSVGGDNGPSPDTSSSSVSTTLGVVSAAEIGIKVARCLGTLCHDNNQVSMRCIIDQNGIELAGLGLNRHFDHGNNGFAALKYLELLNQLYRYQGLVPASPEAAKDGGKDQMVPAIVRGARDPNVAAGLRKCLEVNPGSTSNFEKVARLAEQIVGAHRSALAQQRIYEERQAILRPSNTNGNNIDPDDDNAVLARVASLTIAPAVTIPNLPKSLFGGSGGAGGGGGSDYYPFRTSAPGSTKPSSAPNSNASTPRHFGGGSAAPNAPNAAAPPPASSFSSDAYGYYSRPSSSAGGTGFASAAPGPQHPHHQQPQQPHPHPLAHRDPSMPPQQASRPPHYPQPQQGQGPVVHHPQQRTEQQQYYPAASSIPAGAGAGGSRASSMPPLFHHDAPLQLPMPATSRPVVPAAHAHGYPPQAPAVVAAPPAVVMMVAPPRPQPQQMQPPSYHYPPQQQQYQQQQPPPQRFVAGPAGYPQQPPRPQYYQGGGGGPAAGGHGGYY
jgi:hypothetical protein